MVKAPSKSKTTINIATPVFEAAKAQAEREVRDFGFICERALRRDLGIFGDSATSESAEIIAWADELGTKRALKALRREGRTLKAS